MKKIILLLAGVITLLFSCKDTTPNTVFIPGISFLDTYYEIPKGGYKVLSIAIDAPFDAETRIKVKITGGELGVDYTLEGGDEIIIEAGKRTAELKIGVPMEITESKILAVSIEELPAGYDGGRFSKLTIKTSIEPTLSFSFIDSRVVMYGSTRSVEVALYDKNGHKVTQLQDVRIKIIPEVASTAILGKHYRFLKNNDYVEIKAGNKEGYITVESLLYEDDENTIVLACGEPANYYNGNIPFVSVVLPKSIESGLHGKWRGLKWTSAVEDYELNWGLTPGQVGQLVNSISETDFITFKADKTMSINMTGPLSSFFRNCTWEIDGTEKIVIGVAGIRPIRIDAPICKLSVVNYSFSDSNAKLRAGNMKVYITNDIEYGDMLNIYVSEGDYDYENSPIPFLWGYEPLKYTFVRVADSDK